MSDIKDSKIGEKKILPITKNVTVKKESEFSKLKKQFFTEDVHSVKGYVLTNVIIPGIQRLLSDVVKNSIDWVIWGIKGNSNPSGIRNVSYTSYYSNQNRQPSYQQQAMQSASQTPGAYRVNEIIFNDRGEAEETLLRLKEEAERYGTVSVADFYDMVSIKHSFTDVKYGWSDLRSADIQRNRDGYSIRFPKVIVIE